MSGTEGAVGIHQVRDVDLGIAMLPGMGVEHELDQGTVQPRQRPLHDHEAGARDAGRCFKIKQAAGLPQIDMVPGCEVKLSGIAPATHDFIVFFRLTFRYRGMGRIGDADKDEFQIVLKFFKFRLRSYETLTEGGHFGL